MKIDVKFSELTDFYVTFSENAQLFDVGFSEAEIKYIGEVPVYEGSYRVTPAVSAQTLETAFRVLTEDIHIAEIPFATASNQSGGMTATIGG